MHIDENWAVSLDRVQQFFAEQSDVILDSENRYLYADCIISLQTVSPQSGLPFVIPRTRILIDGNEADVKTIHRRFFLRFLSAGG